MADQELFLQYYLENEDRLRAFLRMLVRDRTDYDDLWQAVALTLWRRFDSYDDSRPFGPWARGVALREVLSSRRRSYRSPIPLSDTVIDALCIEFDRQVPNKGDMSRRLRALEKCVGQLPPKSRSMLELRYQETRSMASIADALSSTAAAVQRALSRVRARLAECIAREVRTEQ
jgi:RNA polymerase sigma-70 factor (ECF subfamily)